MPQIQQTQQTQVNKKFWDFKMLDKKEENQASEAELLIYGEICSYKWVDNDVTAYDLAKELKELGDVATINVRINSPGGDVFSGQAIYSMLKRHKATVNVYIDGLAASAASLIAMAGDKVIMPQNAMLMIHNPWSVVVGDSDEMRKTADTLDNVREAVLAAYINKSGLSREKCLEIMKEETWITAQVALDNGFIDEIEQFDNVNATYANKILMLANKDKVFKSNNNVNTTINNERKTEMSVQPTNVPIQESIDTKTIASKAQTEENSRVLEIISLCNDFKISNDEVQKFIKDKTSVDQVRMSILDKQKSKMQAIENNNIDTLTVKSAEEDKIRDAMSDGILMRGGVRVEKAAEGSNDFRGLSLERLAIDCLLREGHSNVHKMGIENLFKMALTPDSQFASVLSASVNKSMSTAYKAVNTTYQIWTGKGSNKDFKSTTHYQISEAGVPEEMTQTGEFKFDEMSDNGVSKQIKTYGKKFGFTRQAIINDDLGILTKVPMAYVRSTMRLRNRLVYAFLADTSKTIYDGYALFDNTNHGNLPTGAALSVTSLGAARAAMRLQTNLRGDEILNIQPAFLLVPTGQETVAQQLLLSINDPAANTPNIVNPFKGSLQLVCDAELDQYDSNAWYLAASPMDIDTIEFTTLNGNEMPTLESQASFDYLGIEWRMYDDFGVTVLDYRGLLKNANAS